MVALFILTAVVVLSWAVAEAKGKMAVRLTLGIASLVLVMFTMVQMADMRVHFANEEARSCLIAVRDAIREGQAASAQAALDRFAVESRSDKGESARRYRLLGELTRISKGQH